MIATEFEPAARARPMDEERRLAALHRYNLLDTPSCEDFTFLTELAARICDAPYAFISLVDEDRVWVKSYTGMKAESFPRDQSYCSLAILSPDLTDIPDLTKDWRTADLELTVKPPHMRMYSGFTLTSSDGYPLGTLSVLDVKPRKLNDDQRRMLGNLSRQVMALIELRANERALQASLQELETLASTDDLTGLHNRRSLLDHLKVEFARARRYRSPMSVVMLDMDSFKRINDQFGHAAGDLVLANVGRLVRDSVRLTDVAGRYGGEELCVVLPGTTLEGGRKFAEGLRLKIAALEYRGVPGLGAVTASLGVAAIVAGGDADEKTLLKSADEAMYRAKHAGRNRVEW